MMLLVAASCGDDDGGSKGPSDDMKLDAGTRPEDGGRTDGSLDSSMTTKPDARPPFNNAFAIRGRLAAAPGDKRTKAGGDAAIEHSVTHVMAVNPAAANPTRYIQPVAPDGSFAIGVDLHTPWVIVLVDGHQVGANMIAGVFRASDFDLDSIAATAPGMLDMGDLNVDGNTGTATASVSTSSLLSALGLSTETATLLGSMDDISLRYVNPDIDGNGMIDAQEGVSYGLDFHLRFTMSDGSQTIGLDGLFNRYADPATTRATYSLGSAIASWGMTRFGVTTVADYRVRFPTSSGTFSAPPSSASYSANVWIEDDAWLYTSAGPSSVGISFDNTQPFPIGEYDFEVKGTQLTFTDVRTHTLEELNRGADLVIPFLKLNTRESACTGWSCQVSGFDYKWMKRTEAGWVEATAQEVALLVPQQGGYISLNLGTNRDKRLEFVIPGNPTTGTLSFSTPSNATNVSPAEIAALTAGEICHLGVSYDDTLGMRIFQGWNTNPSCDGIPH
ncbi:MAG TPA: hypothetical protein VI299_15860 [Polyangiales bacterium]